MKIAKTVGSLCIVSMASLSLTACLESESSSKDKEYEAPDLLVDTGIRGGWSATKVVTPNKAGLMNPYFDVIQSSDENIHFIYYNFDEQFDEDNNYLFDLKHLVWNPATNEPHMGQDAITINTFDHSDRMSVSKDNNDQLYLTYRGGNPKPCNGNGIVADTMFSVFDGASWTEYTGAIGYVERSAGVLLDGHAGAHADIAIDQEGSAHMIYQFAYEGCDATNFNYPDLFYVKKMPSQFENDDRSDAEAEEQISGNDYLTGGNSQNNTGSVTDLFIGNDGTPYVFYYAITSLQKKGLYFSYRENDQWHQELITDDCRVADVSAAENANGDLFVAYVAERCDSDDETKYSLRFARKMQPNPLEPDEEMTWEDTYVDEGVTVGGLARHMDMTIDITGRPLIAYYELQTYSENDLFNLKLAQFSAAWRSTTQVLADRENIGQLNKIWVGQNEKVYVATYSESESAIYLLSQNED